MIGETSWKPQLRQPRIDDMNEELPKRTQQTSAVLQTGYRNAFGDGIRTERIAELCAERAEMNRGECAVTRRRAMIVQLEPNAVGGTPTRGNVGGARQSA